jgi:hypothetical protein
MTSLRILKCLVDNLGEDRRKMLAFVIQEHPETTVGFSSTEPLSGISVEFA